MHLNKNNHHFLLGKEKELELFQKKTMFSSPSNYKIPPCLKDYNTDMDYRMIQRIDNNIKHSKPNDRMKMVVCLIAVIVFIVCCIVILWVHFKNSRQNIEKLSALIFWLTNTFTAVAIAYTLLTYFGKEEKSDIKDFCNQSSQQWMNVIRCFDENTEETQNLFNLLFNRSNYNPRKSFTTKEILIIQLLFQIIEDFHINIQKVETHRKDSSAWVYHMAHVIFSEDRIVSVWNESKHLYGNKGFMERVTKDFILNNCFKK